jgi:ubiquinone/menaquinone biosynthesis C-methylase UbiE
MPSEPDTLLQGQIAYYRARAGEYNEWWQRLGRYDHGAEWNTQWISEVEAVKQQLAQCKPAGDVLELACGTGWWTEQLAQCATTLTAVDASAEVLALNQQRLAPYRASVRYLQADLFTWQPDRQYDLLFFSFWLSHVPPSRFAAFWDLVQRALRPEGRVFFIDSLGTETMTARDQTVNDPQTLTSLRRLNDGQEFRIIKIFYQPADLMAQLSALGWQVTVHTTANYFLYGIGQRRKERP